MNKTKFTCPVAEEDADNYTTDECKDCCCFWDCKKGIEECLKDDDFKEAHDELKKALKEMV